MFEIDLDYYYGVYGGNVLPPDDSAVKILNRAFRQINIICRNRLKNGEIDTYDEEVQNTVKTIICEQADFNVKNDDLINSALERYTINGVTIEYATNSQISNINGVLINSALYDELNLTGLTYRGL